MAKTIPTLGIGYYDELKRSYTRARDFLVEALESAGFRVATPCGAYFILADFSAHSEDTDVEFAKDLVSRVGVSAVPPSCFYPGHPELARKLVRFAFCKTMPTLEAAAERLRALGR